MLYKQLDNYSAYISKTYHTISEEFQFPTKIFGVKNSAKFSIFWIDSKFIMNKQDLACYTFGIFLPNDFVKKDIGDLIHDNQSSSSNPIKPKEAKTTNSESKDYDLGLMYKDPKTFKIYNNLTTYYKFYDITDRNYQLGRLWNPHQFNENQGGSVDYSYKISNSQRYVFPADEWLRGSFLEIKEFNKSRKTQDEKLEQIDEHVHKSYKNIDMKKNSGNFVLLFC